MGDVGRTLGFGGPQSPEDQYKLPGLLSQMLGGVGQTDQSLAPQAGEQDMVSKYLDHWNQSYPQPPNSPPTQAAAPDEKPINIDGWKPHHRTTLGTIADMLLSAASGHVVTPFAAMKRDQNMQEAMDGFTQDPENTIRRIARINPKLALELQEKYTDNSRQQGSLERQNKVFDLKLEEIVRDRTAGILGTITPTMDPETRSRVIQRAKTYASGKGFQDISDSIPEGADQIDIDSIRYGEIPVVKQEQLERSDRRLDQGDRRLDQGDTRLTQTGEHQKATEAQAAANEAGRQNRHDNPVAKPPATSNPALKPVMTKYGPLIPSKGDPRRAILNHGGKTYGYTNINGTWVPVGEVTLQ